MSIQNQRSLQLNLINVNINNLSDQPKAFDKKSLQRTHFNFFH